MNTPDGNAGSPAPTGSALLPCPFCNRCPTVKCLRRRNHRWLIRCAICGCCGPHTTEPENAVAEWNWRASPLLPPNAQAEPRREDAR